MPEEKITLDRKTFRSLASDTRISILKSLDVRRKMLTELAKEMGMSPSTVKEHMESLRKAGLVQLKDDGHKWKYYELTRDGKNILHPGDTKIWVILSLSGMALLVTAYDMLTGSLMSAASQLKSGAPDALREVGGAAAPMASSAPVQQIPYFNIVGMVLFAGIFALTLGYYLGTRKSWSLDF
ncbi:MAG: winged helix-turn-helix domain-containing protein [Candidatus Aenigmarchaeota archaeon]|nr:winged helix-turn-helix domain-containing protein [Candidatus Aenigmarchaeota archaeon]